MSGIVVLLAGFGAAPALAVPKPKAATGAAPASAALDTSACSTPAVSQPFLTASDTNWYTLAPGETADNFSGSGWILTGGARIITAQLADGQIGSVLDLPSGSIAVSPSICVESDYPTARAVVNNTPGQLLPGSSRYRRRLAARAVHLRLARNPE